jgi:uncharacterized protein (DUF2267 family)
VAESQFLQLVAQAAGVASGEARQAARATLCTLAERITRGEAEDIAAFLPGEFRGLLAGGRGLPSRSACRSSFAASLDALSSLEEQLSNDFGPLLELARNRSLPSPPRFADQRTGCSRTTSRAGLSWRRPR